MKILLIYEAVPDNSYIYVLDDVSAEDWKWMKLTHGRYVNSEMPEAAEKACVKLSEYLVGKTRGEASDNAGKPLPLSAVGFDYFVHTGLLL